MKIGIITYQNTLNFGAALQCYALFNTCENLGEKVEIIDYRNELITKSIKPLSILTNRGKKKVTPKLLLKLMFVYPLVKSKERAFRSFDSKYMNYSKEVYDRKKIVGNSPPVYDRYIIGSDQVWNYNINGLDTTYFMDFVEEKNKVFSYASSFGLYQIENEKKEIYIKHLNSIPSISVREHKGAEIIENLTEKKVQVLADPVFLKSKNEWLESFQIKQEEQKDQIFTYFLNHNTRVDFEKELNENKELVNLTRIKLAGGIKPSDFIKNEIDVDLSNSPVDFIKKINQSKYVFTDSFHGTVFSIVMNKNFLVFLSGDEGRDSRIINLLQEFNLEDRIYTKDLNSLNIPIDYERVNKKCALLKEEGKAFLKKNLQ